MTTTPALVDTIRNLVADAASPAELAEFEAELATTAGADAIAVLGRWAMRVHPLTEAEAAAVERFRRTGEWQL